VELTDRPHALRIDYLEWGAGTAVMRLRWEQEGGFKEQVIPPEALSHERAAAAKAAVELPEAERVFFATEPRDAAGYLLRAEAHLAKGQHDEARADYGRWLQLAGANADANKDTAALQYNNLAWRLATEPAMKGRLAEVALECATRACQLTGGGNWSYLDTLAAAYADANKFREAVQWQKRAVALAPAESKADAASRLKLYQVGKPYRTPAN
jgi:tetratricopeptide (TPR) repeat protein